MADFQLDELTGDLIIDGGMKLITNPAQEARQWLEQGLAINLGEWFADVTAGLPYIKNPKEDLPSNIRYFLGDKFPDSPRFITNTLDKYINDQPFISSGTSEYTFNNRTRVYTYNFTGVLVDGTPITFRPFTSTL